jgi:hypothetical protein
VVKRGGKVTIGRVVTRGPIVQGHLPPREPPIAVAISQAEQDHIAELHRRSYELAIERGHIIRT